MYKFLLCLVLFVSACNKDEEVDDISKAGYENYIIICKHPLGHVMRHVVSRSAWLNSHGSRSGLFRFRDVEGVYHENSGHCYTNDKLRANKEGNEN